MIDRVRLFLTSVSSQVGRLLSALPRWQLVLGALLVIVVILAVWLLLRWRRANAPKSAVAPKGDAAPQGRMLLWIDEVLESLRYLSTRREWRYTSPWVLLLGEAQGGKSSLAASLHDSHREQTILPRQRKLQVSGTSWHFCSAGVLIDPDGNLPVADQDSEDGKRWQSILSAIDSRRPERPIDAAILVVSAQALQTASAAQLQSLADNCYRQLWELQKQFSFILPVYLAITRCDQLAGYRAFWNAQPEARRQELFGWSNPSLEDHPDAENLSAVAMAELQACLQRLQIEAAADRQQLADADDFFLFPQRFEKLRQPLGLLLGTLLQPSAYHASFLFRGMYFTGSLAAGGALSGKVCEQVDSVNALLTDKVFREPHLARPVQQSIWSRNQLIRRVQIGGVILAALLALALVRATLKLHEHINALKGAFAQVHQTTSGHVAGQCFDKGTVYGVLESILAIHGDLTYLAVPASWLDSRVIESAGVWLSKQAFSSIVMPSLACRLEQKAYRLAHLARAPLKDPLRTSASIDQAYGELDRYIEEALALERHIALFNRMARHGEQYEPAQAVSEFIELTRYVYGEALRSPPTSERGVFYEALSNATYPRALRLPTDLNGIVTATILQQAAALHKELLAQVTRGGTLVIELEQAVQPGQLRQGKAADPNLGERVAAFVDWLDWMRANWMDGSREESGICAVLRKRLELAAQLYRDPHANKKLEETLALLSAQQCYEAGRKRLQELRFVPYGAMFQSRDGGKLYEPSPGVAGEVAGLAALTKLALMSEKSGRAFSCQPAISGWSDALLGQAGNYLREYQVFAQTLKADAAQPTSEPLFERLARRQLEATLAGVLADAQQRPAPKLRQSDALDLEAALAEQSKRFARQAAQLEPLAQLSKLGAVGLANQFSRCVRGYAIDMLLRIDTLAQRSQLYHPIAATTDPSDETGEMYVLGDEAQLKDYLLRQRDRSAVLATYAEPFVKYLDASPLNEESARPPAASPAFWHNTLAELKRYRELKEPNGALARLETYFANVLRSLDYENCSKLLAQGPEPDDSLDLFSQSHRMLAGQSDWRCEDRHTAEIYLQYRQLASRFNNELAGRYPFGGGSARDADPDVVRSFFLDYDAARTALGKSMARLRSGQWREFRRFIESLDGSANFLRPLLSAAGSPQPVRLVAGFRALPERSIGAEQLIRWRLSSGLRLLDYPDGGNQLEWAPGEPLALELSWASQSVWRPQPQASQEDLQVGGPTARFTGTAPWGLLRLIDAHRPLSVAPVDHHAASRCILEFAVPIHEGQPPVRQSAARVYLSLELNSLDAKTQTAQPLALPREWPRVAPLSW